MPSRDNIGCLDTWDKSWAENDIHAELIPSSQFRLLGTCSESDSNYEPFLRPRQ